MKNVLLFNFVNFLVINKGRIVNQNTDIVLEGFPRSANTYSYVMLNQSNFLLTIAHHFHYPINIIKGVRKNIPVIILIRRPEDAILSQMIRNPKVSFDEAFIWYKAFYTQALIYKDSIVVAEFQNVIKNFNDIILKVNKKYDLSLDFFDDSKLNIDRCKQIVVQMDKNDNNKTVVDLSRVALPNKEKSSKKEALKYHLNDFDKLEELNILYNKLIEK